ncbi:unnamed protein product [Amoebophrya sp. A120]|nr:unnamed protein product [Amoebophrya sp. A120]|eukprot:GSA120T00001666001.1
MDDVDADEEEEEEEDQDPAEGEEPRQRKKRRRGGKRRTAAKQRFLAAEAERRFREEHEQLGQQLFGDVDQNLHDIIRLRPDVARGETSTIGRSINMSGSNAHTNATAGAASSTTYVNYNDHLLNMPPRASTSSGSTTGYEVLYRNNYYDGSSHITSRHGSAIVPAASTASASPHAQHQKNQSSGGKGAKGMMAPEGRGYNYGPPGGAATTVDRYRTTPARDDPQSSSASASRNYPYASSDAPAYTTSNSNYNASSSYSSTGAMKNWSSRATYENPGRGSRQRGQEDQQDSSAMQNDPRFIHLQSEANRINALQHQMQRGGAATVQHSKRGVVPAGGAPADESDHQDKDSQQQATNRNWNRWSNHGYTKTQQQRQRDHPQTRQIMDNQNNAQARSAAPFFSNSAYETEQYTTMPREHYRAGGDAELSGGGTTTAQQQTQINRGTLPFPPAVDPRFVILSGPTSVAPALVAAPAATSNNLQVSQQQQLQQPISVILSSPIVGAGPPSAAMTTSTTGGAIGYSGPAGGPPASTTARPFLYNLTDEQRALLNMTQQQRQERAVQDGAHEDGDFSTINAGMFFPPFHPQE